MSLQRIEVGLRMPNVHVFSVVFVQLLSYLNFPSIELIPENLESLVVVVRTKVVTNIDRTLKLWLRRMIMIKMG